MKLFCSQIWLAWLTIPVTSLSWNTKSRQPTALPPSQDPFYSQPPPGFENLPPGTILGVRDAAGVSTTFNASSAAYQILYRTTDSFNAPLWALTTLLIPKTPNATFPGLLSYQVPYNTANVDYSISALLDGPPQSLGLTYSDVTLALGNGFYVTVPDHEGPHAAYAAGLLEGHVVLDGIRAVLGSGYLSDPRITRYAVWGYSGGSIASSFATELAPSYAPELSLSGSALGGLVVNATNTILALDGGDLAGLIPAVMLGIFQQYTDEKDYLISQLKTTGPYNETGFLSALTDSLAQLKAQFANQSVLELYFINNGTNLLQQQSIASVIARESSVGTHGGFHSPAFVYKAVHDELVPIADSDALVCQQCMNGSNIFYERNLVGGHIDESVNGDASAWEFIESALTGRLAESGFRTSGCVISLTNVSLSDTGV